MEEHGVRIVFTTEVRLGLLSCADVMSDDLYGSSTSSPVWVSCAVWSPEVGYGLPGDGERH